jgi:hypothetical protein
VEADQHVAGEGQPREPLTITEVQQDILENLTFYLRTVSPKDVALDPGLRWYLYSNIMTEGRRLRREGVTDPAALIRGSLGGLLHELGVDDGLLEELQQPGKLGSRVLAAHNVAEQARKAGPPSVLGTTPPEAAVVVKVSSVRTARVSWLWHHRMPLGKVTVVDGDPGLGKSTMMLDIAARESTGRPMPGDDHHRDVGGDVLVLSAEDGIEDTIRPRLEAAGADLDRIEVLTACRDAQGRPRPPIIPDDISTIREVLRRSRARLVVIDPLMAYLSGRVDSHRDQDVRGALHQLAEAAEESKAAVVIIRHLNKAAGGHALYRGGGSIGIIGAARAGLLVAPDPKDETLRVLAMTKSNLGPIPPSLSYRLVQAGDVSQVEWLGISESSARDLLMIESSSSDSSGARSDAEGFLLELLAEGPVAAKSAISQAREAGIAPRTLQRARAGLGVRTTKTGGRFGGENAWYWELQAPEGAKAPEDASPFGKAPSAFLAPSGGQ